MKISHKISMDLDRYSAPGFDAVCGDRYTRELEIALYAGGVAWEIPAGTAVTVRYQKPDGTAGSYDLLPDGTAAWRICGNVVTVIAAPQALTVPGCVILTVCLRAEDREISTFRILMNVRPAVGLETSESGDYWYLSGSLPQPENAAVGEVLVVDSVDSRGRVTGLKTAEMNGVGASGLSANQVSALEALLKLAAYTEDPAGAWAAFQTAFGPGSVPVPATGITLSAYALSFAATEAQLLTAVLAPADTTDLLVWSTSNAAVATVRDGLVTPVGHGSCTITASAGSVSASCAVTVAFPEELVTYGVTYNLTNVTCSENAAVIEAGDSFTADIIAMDGYTLGTVTVTMGGVDITNDAVSYDSIAIGSVAGEIVITATGEKIPEAADTYTVTNNLTNVTTNNQAVSVEAGASYSAVLKAAAGYLLESITVTMDGADVTAEAVSGTSVNIGSVTGNVVITASAVADNRTLLYNWDFTQSMVDTVAGAEATLSGATQDSSGVTIDAGTESVFLGNFWDTNRTIEVDFSDFSPIITATHVLVMFGSSNGFSRWANGNTWGIYCNGTWSAPDPKFSDRNYFAHATLKLKVAEDGTISVYRNDEFMMTSTQTFATAEAPIHIGKVIGSSYGSVQPITVTGCRIYEGVE